MRIGQGLFQRVSPRVTVILIFVMASAIAFASCNGTDSDDGEAVIDEDPAEAAIEILDLAEREDWDAFRDRLAPSFHGVPPEEVFDAAALGYPVSLYADRFNGTTDEWETVDHKVGSMVVLREVPAVSLILTPVDGEWRLDPGSHVLQVAERIDRGDQPPTGPAYVDTDIEAESIQVEEFDYQTADPQVTETLAGIGIRSAIPNNGSLTMNVVVIAQNVDDITLSVSDIEIIPDSDDGLGELVWTGEEWSDDQIHPYLTTDGTSLTDLSLHVDESAIEDSGAELVIHNIQLSPIEEPEENGTVSMRADITELVDAAPE